MIPEVNNLITTSGAGEIDPKNPKSIAARVQAMFMEIMVKAMEESVGAEDGLFGKSANSEIYRSMFREQLAATMTGQLGGALSVPLEQGLRKQEKHNENSTPHLHEIPSLSSELPVPGVITSEVGWRPDPFSGAMKLHKGTDIAAASGTPIQAVEGGTVIESGARGTFGNAVVIQTDDGRRMLYAHNQQNFVRVGERVARGAAIAAVGSTGRATGPHVHFEVLE